MKVAIAVGSNLTTLQEKCQALASDGYTPYGTVKENSTVYYQQWIKLETPQEEKIMESRKIEV